eukprot:1203750-Rhodomonas_salina.1
MRWKLDVAVSVSDLEEDWFNFVRVVEAVGGGIVVFSIRAEVEKNVLEQLASSLSLPSRVRMLNTY